MNIHHMDLSNGRRLPYIDYGDNKNKQNEHGGLG